MTSPLDASIAATSQQFGRFVVLSLLVLELALAAVVLYLFEVESHRHLLPLFCLSLVGFAIHAWLPLKFRRPFFAVLSVASVVFILGVRNGTLVLALGGGLIAACYLPIVFSVKVAVVALIAAGLVVARSIYPVPIWPVLGSMFMFRLVIFMLEFRKAKVAPPWEESIAYFFMIPNVCFPLFPVVDFHEFHRRWYDEDEIQIYQRGVQWITRGLVQLLLYRLIKGYAVPAPIEIDDPQRLALFMATNYALYLHVSGQFHLVTGILHLFGFNLQPTHQWFFLASSFTDIWRRINIYWKEFITKFFFFPAFHAARQRGATATGAILLGVLASFVATWLLHSWQTFWLLGHFPLALSDAVLWLSAGVFLAINSLWELHRGRSTPTHNGWWAIRSALATVGMFTLVSLFWAVWTEPEFGQMVRLVWQAPQLWRGVFVVLVVVVLAWLFIALMILAVTYRYSNGLHSWKSSLERLPFRESVQLQIVGLGLCIVVASPSLSGLVGSDAAQHVANFRQNPATRRAAEVELRSYYEALNSASIQAGPLIQAWAELGGEPAKPQALGYEKVSQKGDSYLEVELIPNIRVELGGRPFSVNRFGMRDRANLDRQKLAGVTRIAVLGSSVVMGYGVSDEEVFGRLLEEQLNLRASTGTPRYEVLNFGVGKHWSINRLFNLQRNVSKFAPDVVYYVAHQDEFTGLASHLAKLVSERRQLLNPRLDQVVQRAGISHEMAWGAIQSQLELQQSDLLAAIYGSIVDECRRIGAVAAYIYLPIPGTTTENPSAKLLEIAKGAGFHVGDLSDWYAGHEAADLFASDDPLHPDARGHRLIAEALVRLVEARPELLRPAQ